MSGCRELITILLAVVLVIVLAGCTKQLADLTYEKIVDEIIGRYKGAGETPVNKWRKSRLHRRCEFCKHCVLGTRDVCDPKNKFVNSRAPRPFCSCFQLKPYKEN